MINQSRLPLRVYVSLRDPKHVDGSINRLAGNTTRNLYLTMRTVQRFRLPSAKRSQLLARCVRSSKT